MGTLVAPSYAADTDLFFNNIDLKTIPIGDISTFVPSYAGIVIPPGQLTFHIYWDEMSGPDQQKLIDFLAEYGITDPSETSPITLDPTAGFQRANFGGNVVGGNPTGLDTTTFAAGSQTHEFWRFRNGATIATKVGGSATGLVAAVAEVTTVDFTGNSIIAGDSWLLNAPGTDYYVWYQTGVKEVTSVGFTSHTIVGGDHWLINDPTTSYYVWYTVDAGGADPVPGGTGILVAILGADSPAQVATKTATAINAFGDFSVPAPGANVITVTNANVGAATDASDATAGGLGITVTTQGVTAGSDPSPGGTGITVAVLAADTPAQIATKTATAIDAEADFSVPAPGANVITVTNANIGSATDAADATAGGLVVTTETQGAAASGGDPAPGGTGLSVELAAGDSDAVIATKTQVVINGEADFSVPAPGANIITVTNATVGNVVDASDVDSDVLITTTVQGVDLFTALAVIDGVNAQISVDGGAALTFTTLLSEINTDLSGAATIALVAGDLVVTSDTTGPDSSVFIRDETLFRALTDQKGFLAPVAGVGTNYTLTVEVDGTPVTGTIAGSAADTFTNLVSAVSTAVAGATVTIDGGNLKVTSDTVSAAGTILIVQEPNNIFASSNGFVGYDLPFAGVSGTILTQGQDETSYDNSPTSEGTFDGGTGHSNTDVLTMSDGSTITVDLQGSGIVTQFTTTTSGGLIVNSGDILTQVSSTGSGVGFTLTPEGDNLSAGPALGEIFFFNKGEGGDTVFYQHPMRAIGTQPPITNSTPPSTAVYWNGADWVRLIDGEMA